METTIPTLVSILDAPEDKVSPIMVAVSYSISLRSVFWWIYIMFPVEPSWVFNILNEVMEEYYFQELP